MLKYDETLITEKDYNTHITGKNNSYSFFELLSYSAIHHLSGENIIGVAYYVTDPYKPVRNYSHISYHKDLKDFFKTDDKKWSGIITMLFKSVRDEKEANEIINDIKSKHSFTP